MIIWLYNPWYFFLPTAITVVRKRTKHLPSKMRASFSRTSAHSCGKLPASVLSDINKYIYICIYIYINISIYICIYIYIYIYIYMYIYVYVCLYVFIYLLIDYLDVQPHEAQAYTVSLYGPRDSVNMQIYIHLRIPTKTERPWHCLKVRFGYKEKYVLIFFDVQLNCGTFTVHGYVISTEAISSHPPQAWKIQP